MKHYTIAFPHRPGLSGGPSTFQTYLENCLKKKGWKVVYPEDGIIPDVILVVGGTRKLKWLWNNKRAGAKIVLRLDGLNWQHRLLPNSIHVKIKAEITNIIVRFIRKYLSNYVIYQSQFIKKQWHRYAGKSPCEECVIYNATDLKVFYPRKKNIAKKLVCIEGSIQPSEAYLAPLVDISQKLFKEKLICECNVYGDSSNLFIKKSLLHCPNISLKGTIPRSEVPNILCDSIYLPLEVNPPCPNSVIEALASGTPVIGYDTGSLRELVGPESGILVPFRGNPWKLEKPDTEPLFCAAKKVIKNWDKYSKGARKTAETKFDINNMVESYKNIFEKVISKSKKRLIN